jgi:DNA polymerase-3 subunit beta
MNISCGNQSLQKALSVVEKFVGKKDTLAVLSCVVFEVTKNKVVLKATNLESGCEVVLPAKVLEEGIVAVPGSNLSSVIRNLRGDHVSLRKTAEGMLAIETPSGVLSMKTLSPEEFPHIPKNNTTPIEIPRTQFIESVQAVSSAASTSLIRPEFASVCLSAHDSFLTTVATDSFRLAEKKVPYKGPDIQELLIPIKNCSDIVSILERLEEENILLSVEDGQLSLSVGSVYVVSRVIDAQFPNYSSIMPKQFSTTVTFLKEDIIQTLRKARFFSHNTQQVTFTITKDCSVSAHHHDVGDMKEVVESKVVGDPITINFNIPYILDCFPSIKTDSVEFCFSGVGKPLIIKGVGDSTYTYLISPLNR